jgi:arylsulfatase A-like enzyme
VILLEDVAVRRRGFIALLFLSAWCGLFAGLLEVGTIVLRKQLGDPDHFYSMSRHFVWLIPLTNLCVFLVLGLFGCGVVSLWPSRGRWLCTRGFGAMVLLPSVLVAFPRIYSLAWLIVALGLATQLVPLFERKSPSSRTLVMAGLPSAVLIVASLAAFLWVGDWKQQNRENARTLPPPGSPNVLLVVLDTVAADHLSLHGYRRSTSPTLVELSQRGIRFDRARAASSWTLPSHANMFTGRWMHELSVGWLTPLDGARPTLAEFLDGRGYATAGFVANTTYCAIDSGLSRGFTHYRDYIFPELTAFKMAVLVSRALKGFQMTVTFAEDWLESAGLMPSIRRIWRSLDTDRKGAAVVNREFLDWLAHRTQPKRPFFVFLNYADAHDPYQLLPGRLHRFGGEPTDRYHRLLLEDWSDIKKSALSTNDIAFAAAAYDECIADLDEQLGKLVDELETRGVLEQTWLIVTADHGESFGEHAGIFCHGKSLYETELHVPLLVIPPGGSATKQVVAETVSLRDLPATIVELAGLEAGAPFPGVSLARLWMRSPPAASVPLPSGSAALAEVVPDSPFGRGSWTAPQRPPPLGAVKEQEWSYIRREGDVREELYHLSEDAREQRNLAGDPSAQRTLEQMRAALDRLTEGPLSPERFSD